MINPDMLIQHVEDIARKAGEFIKNESTRFDASKIEYKGKNNFVSYVDKKAEEMIVDSLHKILPEAGFIAEEGTGTRIPDGLNWVIDPLDGTTNFMHGLPPYSVSIALMDNQTILLGVIYEIVGDECFYATFEGKSYCNGKEIRVSDVSKAEEGLYVTGFPYTEFSRMEDFFKIMDHFLRYTHGLRRLGSAAADLAYVACGRSEGFFEFSLNPWDVAAGGLIVQRAGGIVTDFSAGDNWIFGRELIAGNQTQPEMLKIINKYWKR